MGSTVTQRHRMTAVVLTAVAGLLAACGGGSGATAGPKHVTFVSVKGVIEWWPVQFGQEQGIFSQEGLDLSSVQAKSGPEITSIVTSGSADLGMGALEGIVAPISQGGALKILDIPGVTPLTSIIASPKVKRPNADAGYPNEVRDLKGLKIGLTSLGSPQERYVKRLLKDAGMSISDVTFIAVGGPSTALTAFTEGKADALSAYAPMTQALDKDAYVTIVDSNDMEKHASGPANGIYFFAGNSFASSPKAREFCRAMDKVYAEIKESANKAKAVKSLMAWTGLTKDQSAEVFRTLQGRVGGASMDQDTWTLAGSFLTTAPPAFGDAVEKVCSQ